MSATIALSLISHTNAGKTTLARTLLGRDVGEVRDAAHVTEAATSYPLLDTVEGDHLVLWDTPGFGDSARLARRLAQQGSPIGWLLSQVWDRYRDRAFYLSQQAVRNVQECSDVVLYLVNASEAPGDAGYLGPELEVLGWIDKPVIVLLNQTGRPRPRAAEAADEARWREAVGRRPFIRAVVTLDAFARCWVQEIALLELIAPALTEDKRDAFQRINAAWRQRRWTQFDESMTALATAIADAACDREPVPETGVKSTLREVGRVLGLTRGQGTDAKSIAAKALATRLDSAFRASAEQLIAIHQLEGSAAQEVMARLAEGTTLDAPVNEFKAAMMGGVASGALTGLAADIAAGGLTLGAGTLTGAVLGALGGAGIARGINLARGKSGASLRWDDSILNGLVNASLLRYLAVAHFGRGRGGYAQTEYPAFWQPLVTEALAARTDALAALWKRRESVSESVSDRAAIAVELKSLVADAAREVLDHLYPGALQTR